MGTCDSFTYDCLSQAAPAGNGVVQSLLNPMVGLTPRKFNAYLDEGRRGVVWPHTQRCHMECSKMRKDVAWPFDSGSGQLARAGKAAVEPPDPAVRRFPVLDALQRDQVKQLLGSRFL